VPLLDEKPPTDADPQGDPKGEWYAFEKGAMKTGGGGWAPKSSNQWKRGCFAWEYKSPGKDLGAARASVGRNRR
jgi:hypothetical protein